MRPSIEHSRIGPRQAGAFQLTREQVQEATLAHLRSFGVSFDAAIVRAMAAAAMDANEGSIEPSPLSPLTAASIATPVQFLQNWLPGFVRVITAARKIDEVLGISTTGSWEDEEIVQGVMEPLGLAMPYTDYANVPLASWNVNFERRTVVRFEMGFSVGKLEEARTARMRANTAAEKRGAAADALEITRNRVGFWGYNGGANRTFGFLNDPALPAYVPLPNGASGDPEWSEKTFLEITADIRTALAALRAQSLDRIDPDNTPITMVVPTDAVDFLSTTNEFGTVSVREWIRQTYPRLRVVSAPELQAANGGAGVLYFFAEEVQDGASDDSRTWLQAVPARFQSLGVENGAKVYTEDFSNATAGVMLKRPYAVVRYTGVS